MHNRVRMVVASFLIKDLHIGWWHGADWFMEHLRDGDIAQNQLNWQWVAGCGTDAAPYFRIFNPISQGEKFDADGALHPPVRDRARRRSGRAPAPALGGADGAPRAIRSRSSTTRPSARRPCAAIRRAVEAERSTGASRACSRRGSAGEHECDTPVVRASSELRRLEASARESASEAGGSSSRSTSAATSSRAGPRYLRGSTSRGWSSSADAERGEGGVQVRADVDLGQPGADGADQLVVGHPGGPVQHQRHRHRLAQPRDQLEVEPVVARSWRASCRRRRPARPPRCRRRTRPPRPGRCERRGACTPSLPPTSPSSASTCTPRGVAVADHVGGDRDVLLVRQRRDRRTSPRSPPARPRPGPGRGR